jgi:myo-inositol 2-dehydrogenase / D-chiro-inositol 1-dehydrogenase
MTSANGLLTSVGIIGTGLMGAEHARLLDDEVSGVTVAAVFDTDIDRAATLAKSLTSARLESDPFELITNRDIDALLIASPDQTHEQFVLASVEAGKPVLCEKPLAPTVEACQRIVAAEVEGRRRLVSVGFMRRFDGGYGDLKATLQRGEIGRPWMLHNTHRNASAPPDQPASLLVTGSAVHEIDISRWLLDDEIVAVAAHQPARQLAGGENSAPLLLVLQTAGGVLVDIEVFVDARYGYDVHCELVGGAGTVSLDAPAPTAVRRASAVSRKLPTDWRPRFVDAYRRELQHWIDGLHADVPWTGASAWDGYLVTRIAEACLEAVGTHTRVSIERQERPELYRTD